MFQLILIIKKTLFLKNKKYNSVILNYDQRKKITNFLMNINNQDTIIDQDKIIVSPGNFLRFSIVLNENNTNV